MKKEITLSVNSASEMRINNLFASVKKGIMFPIVWLSQYYSAVLNKEISVKTTLQLLNAQVAFALAVFPANAVHPMVSRANPSGSKPKPRTVRTASVMMPRPRIWAAV